jgi:hypothetical protein
MKQPKKEKNGMETKINKDLIFNKMQEAWNSFYSSTREGKQEPTFWNKIKNWDYVCGSILAKGKYEALNNLWQEMTNEEMVVNHRKV